VLDWAKKHDESMLFEVLCSVPRLIEFVYKPAAHAAVKITEDLVRVRLNPGPPAANTRGASPRKGQAQATDKGKPSHMDKGKGKMIEPEKPQKAAAHPLQTGGVFKIYDPKTASPTLKQWVKDPVEAPRVARVLKLVDEEEEAVAEKPTEMPSIPALGVPTLREDSEVEVIEVPLVRKRKLKKAAEIAAPEAAAPEAVPTVAATMANFLAVRRRQAPPPSIPRMEAVEAFLANEPIEAFPVTVAGPVVEQLLRAPDGPIPSILAHPLGSNIQHILEDIDMESEESVGIADRHSGPPDASDKKNPRKQLSPIPETGASSRAVTHKRSQDPTFDEADRASASKRPRTSEASESESSAEFQPEGATWKIGGKLAKLGGDLKGNPFKAVLDLIDYDKLQMKSDVSARGMAEEMLTFQFLVSIMIHSFPFKHFLI
jgi:hypothetical protein